MFRTTFISLAMFAVSNTPFAAPTTNTTTIVRADLKTAVTVYLGDAVGRDSDQLAVDVAGAIASGITQQSQASAALSDASARNANAYVVSQATWASADAGRISISWGWTAQSSGTSTAFDTGAAINWSYTFVAAADGVFRADWLIFTPGTTDTTGLNKLNTSDDWRSPGGSGLGGLWEDPSGSGVSLVPLLAGAPCRHGGDRMPMSRRVDMAACRLRRALRQAGLVQLDVRSMRGVGYRLEVLDADDQHQA